MKCDICGEHIGEDEEAAEMYDPRLGEDAPSVMCHAQCGEDAGYEVA